MFDISWSELMLVGVVALIVIGPKELPGVLRTVGQWMRKVRSMAADFQNQFQEAMREAEMTDLKKQVDDLAHDFKSYDPLQDVRKDVEALGHDMERTLDNKPDERPENGALAEALTEAPAEAPAEALASGSESAPALPDPGAVAAPTADLPLPDATTELADTDAAAGVAPAAPEPAKPDTGGRAA
jgi:sec-independent protein translocase protein TatB